MFLRFTDNTSAGWLLGTNPTLGFLTLIGSGSPSTVLSVMNDDLGNMILYTYDSASLGSDLLGPHSIAVTWNGSDTFQLYLDGTLKTPASIVAPSPLDLTYADTAQFWPVVSWGAPNDPGYGKIVQLVKYSSVLTAGKIASLENLGADLGGLYGYDRGDGILELQTYPKPSGPLQRSSRHRRHHTIVP
jgi:hypothetical protein